MNTSRMYHQLFSSSNYIDPRLIPKSSFRFIVGSPNVKTTDDERLALLDRFCAEGLDVRKISDTQKLPFVWRWLVDAEINCQSLRHTIEKMRMQHDEELQEVEDYIEQVWKLSTERLILLEEENKCLREKTMANAMVAAAEKTSNKSSGRCFSAENNNQEDGDADEEDAEDSDIELEKCLYGGTRKAVRKRSPLIIVEPLNNNFVNASSSAISATRNGNLVPSSSTSSLASSISASAGLNLCDSLKLRSSRSCWNLGPTANGQLADDVATATEKDKSQDNLKMPTNYCEKCEILDGDLVEMKLKIADLEGALDDANEKNFVLEKLNRSIEIENENFAYKLAEAEDRSNQLERRILHLEKECRHFKSTVNSPVTDAGTGASSVTSGHGTLSSAVNGKLVYSANDQSTRRLIDELNHKVKHLEEALDHRLQLYEDLEMKYEKQKVKQHETLWKLRNFMQDKDPMGVNDISPLQDLLLLDDDKTLTLSSTDSGHLTLDHHNHIHHRPRHRATSIHDKLV